jgi:hypothetical protein
MFPDTLRRLSVVPLVLALAAVLSGCGKGGLSQQDLDRARGALESSLNAWQKGESPAKLSNLDPPVEMVDMDWKSGHRLLEHRIKSVEGGQAETAHSWVVLSLQTRKGKKLEKEVLYDIKLGDPITIGRDPMN